MLLKNRAFSDEVDVSTQIISTSESNSLFVRAQGLKELWGYAQYLTDYYHFKDECALQMEEEGGLRLTPAADATLAIVPRNRDLDQAFLENVKHCSQEIHYAKTFETDVLDVINPQRKVVDKFYFFPICPREETSTNGMLLTSATINEPLGLLNKLDDDKFGLDVNALKRRAFVHGDALSCITHKKIESGYCQKRDCARQQRIGERFTWRSLPRHHAEGALPSAHAPIRRDIYQILWRFHASNSGGIVSEKGEGRSSQIPLSRS